MGSLMLYQPRVSRRSSGASPAAERPLIRVGRRSLERQTQAAEQLLAVGGGRCQHEAAALSHHIVLTREFGR